MQKRSSHVWDGRFLFCKEKKMKTQIELKPVVILSESARKAENPMQERYCNRVSEFVEVAAEVVLTARRLEAREEAGPVFIP